MSVLVFPDEAGKRQCDVVVDVLVQDWGDQVTLNQSFSLSLTDSLGYNCEENRRK